MARKSSNTARYNARRRGVPIRLYRPYRGIFDSYRRYSVAVEINGNVVRAPIAVDEVIEIDAGAESVSVNLGDWQSDSISLQTPKGDVLICELAANPKDSPKPMSLYWVSRDELVQLVPKFSFPGSLGGNRVRPFLSVGILAGFVVLWIVGLVRLAIGLALHRATALHLLTSITTIAGGTLIIGFILFGYKGGLRSLYRYFKLPSEWRG